MANKLFLIFVLLSFVPMLNHQEVEATHCKKSMQLFSSLPGPCPVRMKLCLGVCHTSLSWGVPRPVTQHPWVASLYEGSDLEVATVSELIERRSPGVLGDARLRVWLESASDVIGATVEVVIRQPTTEGAVPESASEYLLRKTGPVILSGPVLANADPALPADCRGVEAAFSLSQATSPPVLKFRFAVMIDTSLKKLLCHTLKDYDMTEDVQNLLKGITTIKYFSEASETVISHFQCVSTELKTLRNAIDSSPVTHKTNSISIPIIYHPLPPCKTTIYIHPHLSPTRVENHQEAGREATTAETVTPLHFLSPHFKYVITILHSIISIWCIQNHLCRKYRNRKSSEEGKGSVNALRVRFSREKYQGDVKYPSSSTGPGWQRTDVLHDIIHQYWRSRHQCWSDGESHPSVTVQQCENIKCRSSKSVLCSFCKNQASSHLRSTKHTYTEPQTTVSVTEGTEAFNPQVIQAYPVTRFLPDPTRDPHQDLAHVGYRLATLSAVPASVPVSRVRLADAGFYSRGVNDEVTCYSCHVQHSGWTREDNPMAIHRRLSPHCAHVLQSNAMAADSTAAGLENASHGSRSVEALAPVQNHQVTASASTNSHAEQGPRSSLTPHSGHGGSAAVQEAAAPRTQRNENDSTSSSTLRTEASISTTAASSSRNDASSSSLPNGTATRSSTGSAAGPHASGDRHPATGNMSRPSDQISVNATQGQAGIQSAAPERRDAEPSNPQATTAPNVNVTTASGSTVTSTTSDVRGQGASSTNENARRFLFPRPRLELGGAVYPMYQGMDSRRRSFTSWDEARAPPLSDILLSGMFYAGYGDCVRCFYCGVGLKHWVVGDDVWAEHIRWRPECQYLRAIKGEDFIRTTQRRLANTNSQSSEDPNRNSSNTPASQGEPQASTPRPSNTAPTATTASSSAATAAATTPAPTTTASSTQRTSGTGSNSSSSSSSSNNSSSNSSCSNGRSVTEGQSGAAVSAAGEGARATVLVTATDEQQTLDRLQAENRTLTRNSQCKACRRAPINTILFPCGHLVVCDTCAGSVRSCPLCFGRVEGSARVAFE